jgi:hypothetical protein
MMRALTKKPSRRERRAAARIDEKLHQARVRLARTEPGGRPEFPIEVHSVSIMEPHAEGLACLRCGVGVKVAEHESLVHGVQRLRMLTTRCRSCGAERILYYRLSLMH